VEDRYAIRIFDQLVTRPLYVLKTSSVDLVKESRNVGHNGRAALLPLRLLVSPFNNDPKRLRNYNGAAQAALAAGNISSASSAITFPAALEARMIAAAPIVLEATAEVLDDAGDVFLSLRGRVACTLLELAEHFGEDVGSGRIVIHQKMSDLAALAGIARETVNRILNDWKRHKLVSHLSGYYCLENKAQLERQAQR
jgi:hypothetical protein